MFNVVKISEEEPQEETNQEEEELKGIMRLREILNEIDKQSKRDISNVQELEVLKHTPQVSSNLLHI